MFDILLRGARLVDGTGNPWRWADVGVVDGKIAAVGRLSSLGGQRVIEVDGRVLAPGFIDAHVHLDTALLVEPDASPLLAQGVTTAILGQDGLGFAPASQATLRYMEEYVEAFNPPFSFQEDAEGLSVARYLTHFDKRVAVNVGYLLPHGTIRYNVLGAADRLPDDSELATMVRQIGEGMEQGALGLSTGLEYIPAVFSDTAEITALCREVARYDGLYVTHMRNYKKCSKEAVAEVCAIAQGADVAAHISHFNLPARIGLPLIDAARGNGVDVTIENYPYLAGCTVLSYFLPGWVSEGSPRETMARLADAEVRRRLEPALAAVDWSEVLFSYVPGETNRGLEGQRVAEAAVQAGKSVTDFVCDLLVATDLCVGIIQFHTERNEDDLQATMRHPAQLFGSDGIYRGQRAHPRGWGAFARVLARYAREKQVLMLSDAIRRMSAHPATRYGLWDRGLVREGYAADLVVFDPERIEDRATFQDSRQLAVGMDLVLVNGRVVWDEGRHTGEMAGRALKRKPQ